MMKANEQDKIDSYLKGDMSEEESRAFKQEILSDSSLQEAVTQQSELIQTIREVGKNQDEQMIETMSKLSPEEIMQVVHHKRRTYLPIIILGIASLLLLTVGINYYMRMQRSNALFDKYYTIYTETIISRGAEEDTTFLTAYQLWQNGKTDLAIQKMQSVISQGDANTYYQDAEWYLSLFYLKERDLPKCTMLLKRIVEEGGYYVPKAKQLLQELE